PSLAPGVTAEVLLDAVRRASDLLKRCGAEGNRTPDLFHAMEALYQLSYSPSEEKTLPAGPSEFGVGRRCCRRERRRRHGRGPGDGPAPPVRPGGPPGLRVPRARVRERGAGRGPDGRDIPGCRPRHPAPHGAVDIGGVADRRGPARARGPLATPGSRGAQPVVGPRRAGPG